ncbi:MAG: type IV secretion system protein [Alphaproteobacteria bacterium]|nr:type IV secretion system protein [Alphaproteobacteria bacterium]MBQ2810885.1 type IV secretion system protein [Alphaproteobacteria bacterium]
MAQELGVNNTQQRMLANRQANPSQNARRPVSGGQNQSDDIIVNASERRYLWTARAFAVIVAISLCCNFVLILAITQLMPLYRLEPFILTFENKQEQVYDIRPIANMEDKKEITEVFVREYVLIRSAFSNDIPEMESRWMPGGPIQEMSSSAVYQAFLDKTANKALNIIKNKGLTRSVRIMTVNELGRGLWQVEYETKDMYPSSSAPQVEYWTASLRIAYRKKNVKYDERLNNPIGFTVIRYSLSRNKTQ